jgi:DNA-binding transcriptional LysR family regulator
MPKDPLGRLDLNLVFVFDALLRYQSVTRAATALNVTQGAVSHALRRLREFFNDPLFTRTATGIVPTARALHLAVAVNEIASLVRRGLLNEAPFNPEQAGRTFSVVLTDLGELAVLPTLLSALRKASPGSSLRAVTATPTETHAMLESGEVDIAIGAVPPGTGEIYRQLLYTESAVVVTHKSSMRRGEKMTLDAYCERPHVVVTPLLGRVSVFDTALARLGRKRRVVLTTQHHLILPLLLEQDASLTGTVPEVLARAWQRRGTLKSYKLPFEFPPFEIAQYWHGRFHTDRQHTWFRNLIATCFQRQPPSGKPRLI